MSFQGDAPETDMPDPSTPKPAAMDEEGNDDKPPYSDQAMLNIVRVEMQRSVGFENDQTLRNDRLRALDYLKGDMRSDIPSLENRSKAVDSSISDAVDTVVPDLMEIFTAGGDVVSFDPIKPGDEEAAKQETDYLTHVIFQENDGFHNLMEGFKDGLILKTCVFEFAFKRDYSDEDFTGKTAAELMLAHQSGNVVNIKADPPDESAPNAEPTYSFTVRTDRSQAQFWSLPPDDFSVSPDTVRIKDTTYCVSRHRPRCQDLIAEGFDEDAVLNLEPYAPVQDQQIQQARDTAGEHQLSQQTDTTNDMLRQVEIRKHYIRLKDTEGDDFDIWRIVTNATADVVVPFEGKSAVKMERVPFAAGSPYPISHRFYGMGLADQLIEIQKIKTVLTRALLDSSYFALNQRYEVAMSDANDYTIGDLLRNEPMVPVRSKTGNAVKALGGGSLGFDAYQALEYFSTVAEGRTGVVRNAQGLNPDTLHDTAKGAMALMQAAQRRVRMIARVMAETVIKDLYLGLHALIRENAEKAKVIQLNGKWTDIDPTKWGERNAMTIEVGLGASGRDADLAAYQVLSQDMLTIVEQQGGVQGPLITAQNIYNLAIDKAKALGRKQPERYFADPANAPQQAQQTQPDPKLLEAQMKDATTRRGQDINAQLKSEQTQTEAQLKEYQINKQADTDVTTSIISAHQHTALPNVGIGGNQV